MLSIIPFTLPSPSSPLVSASLPKGELLAWRGAGGWEFGRQLHRRSPITLPACGGLSSTERQTFHNSQRSPLALTLKEAEPVSLRSHMAKASVPCHTEPAVPERHSLLSRGTVQN